MVILFNSLLTHRGRTTLFWLGDSRIKLEAIMFGIVMGLLLQLCLRLRHTMILFPVINFIFVFKNFTESCIVNDDYSEICSFVYKTIKENHTRPKRKVCR